MSDKSNSLAILLFNRYLNALQLAHCINLKDNSMSSAYSINICSRYLHRHCDSATSWAIEKLGLDSRHRQARFLFPAVSTAALGLSQPPAPWLPEDHYLRQRGGEVKLTIHLHLVRRLRIRGAAISMLPCFMKSIKRTTHLLFV
jgi:hypothetical protein